MKKVLKDSSYLTIKQCSVDYYYLIDSGEEGVFFVSQVTGTANSFSIVEFTEGGCTIENNTTIKDIIKEALENESEVFAFTTMTELLDYVVNNI